MEREASLARAFVELADTLVNDYEVADFLYMLCDRANQVLSVDAVGVLVTDETGALRLSAASTEEMRVLELFEVQQRQGPCYDAFENGNQIAEGDVQAAEDRWPEFVPKALTRGFKSVHAFPLRLRNERIGALNMFRYERGAFDDRDVQAGQALADVATIGILQERAVREERGRAKQLQHALDSRVLIEQAKGVLAARMGLEMNEAFNLIRRHARDNNTRIRLVCRDVIDEKWPSG